MAYMGWRVGVFGHVLAFALAIALGPAHLFALESGRVVVRNLRSESLSHSLAGSNAVRELTVYLPPGYDGSSAQRYPVIYFLPNPFEQSDRYDFDPRQHFEEDDLNELAETIRKSGVYQAILARPKDDRLEIVFGARRFRASQLAGKETIPAQNGGPASPAVPRIVRSFSISSLPSTKTSGKMHCRSIIEMQGLCLIVPSPMV